MNLLLETNTDYCRMDEPSVHELLGAQNFEFQTSPNENRFDSGQPHVIVPVRHPESSEVHNIAIAEGTPLSCVADALSDAGYLHTAQTPQSGPTKEGSLEASDAFPNAAKNAVAAARILQANRHSSCFVQRNQEQMAG